MENIDLISKIVLLLGAMIGLPRIAEELRNMKRSRLQEEYRFVRDFITNLDTLHPFLIEKGYQAISGNSTLSAPEIIYLLSLKMPNQALRHYAAARKYLHFSSADSSPRIQFKEKYGEFRRRWLKRFYLASYGLFVSLAAAPLIFGQALNSIHWALTIILEAVFLAIFAPLAYIYLADYNRITQGEDLLRLQEEDLV